MGAEMVRETVWVIIREVGEYSDREVTPIRYCLSEESAKAAVALADEQKQMNPSLWPEYKTESTLCRQMPDGSLVYDMEFRDPRWRISIPISRPDAEQVRERNQRHKEQYEAAIAALGHVDPRGCHPENYYSYEPVTLWRERDDGR